MPNYTYTRERPAGQVSPAAQRATLQTNNDSNDSIWNVDHYGFNDNDGGYHQKSTYVVQTSDPAPVASSVEVYSKNLTTGALTQPELYALHPTGSPVLMTRGLPVPASGEGVLYGGQMIRCGSGTGPGTNIAVTFSSAFPTACTVAFVISNNNSRTWNTSNLSTTGFTANASSSLGGSDSFFWFAIGY